MKLKRITRPKSNQPIAQVKPTTSELYWAAGFIEGEGGFAKTNSSSFVLSVGQVNKEPLEKLAKLFGGNIKIYPTRQNGVSKSPMNLWRTYGPRARGIALTLYSLLSNKRQEQVRKYL